MKALQSMEYDSKTLTVLLETYKEDSLKGYISYFVNGNEVRAWSELDKKVQFIFTSMADAICDKLRVTRWKYIKRT